MYEKPADSKYPIHDLIAGRWSPVAFSERAVEPKCLCSLFEAVRWAPSCYNDQPWNFVVGIRSEPDPFQELLSCLVPQNAEWAQYAPVLALAIARTKFSHNGKPNRHAWHDIGLAIGNLLVQATSMGLAVHPMAGFLPDKAREVLALPVDHEPVTAIAIGYPGESTFLSEALRVRNAAPRSRRPASSFVHSGRWGRRPEWLD